MPKYFAPPNETVYVWSIILYPSTRWKVTASALVALCAFGGASTHWPTDSWMPLRFLILEKWDQTSTLALWWRRVSVQRVVLNFFFTSEKPSIKNRPIGAARLILDSIVHSNNETHWRFYVICLKAKLSCQKNNNKQTIGNCRHTELCQSRSKHHRASLVQ